MGRNDSTTEQDTPNLPSFASVHSDMPPARTKSPAKAAPTPKRVTRGAATPKDKAAMAAVEDDRKNEHIKAKAKFSPLGVLLRIVAACMLGPCVNHAMDLGSLEARVADLGFPFTLYPKVWAVMVLATETVGTLLIVSNKKPKLGATILLPKMLVAVYGHAMVDGFDTKFASGYASAYTPPGLSYGWSVGASWECGILGAGYFLITYGLLAMGKMPLKKKVKSA